MIKLFLTYICLSSFVSAGASETKEIWMAAYSPVKLGSSPEIRKETRIWLHRPSQSNFIDATEEYLPGLPASVRLEAYCKVLKSGFDKIDYYKVDSKNCVVLGTDLKKVILHGAFLVGDQHVRHFVSNLTSAKLDKNKIQKDLIDLLDKKGSLK
jgi:hypothetical protein